MSTNRAGIDLIKHFEGFRPDAYLCPAGVWTIGYGHTHGVHAGDSVSRAEAERLLLQDIEDSEQYVNELVDARLTSNQYSALVSFVFNVGYVNFLKSTLLALLNKNEHAKAALEFKRWNRGGGQVLQGLVKRRRAERRLFLTPDDEAFVL